jgi:membrane protease subunit (stomatin/prohibitin family)
MGLLSFIKSQLIDVIDWTDDSRDTLVWRFPDGDHEIKNGARLTVREGQAAVFVNEGQIADVFPPGLYALTTQNIPLLTKLKSWKYGFDSPFKAEVYFVNTRQFMDMEWGTATPILLRDQDFGAVRVGAYGSFAIQVVEPRTFMKEVVGTDGHYTTDEIQITLRRFLVSSFTVALGKAKIPVLDLAGSLDTTAATVEQAMQPEFGALGLKLRKFVIVSASLPPEVTKAVDERGSIAMAGDLNKYSQYQMAKAMRESASVPGGGGARVGLDIGAAIAVGQAFSQGMAPHAAPASAAPVPVSAPAAVGAGLVCGGCRAPVSAGAKFCPECGNKIEAPRSRFCPECGAEVGPSAKFCPGCGTKQG